MLGMLHDKVVDTQGSLLGFEQLNRFLVTVLEENSSYAFMQSLEDEYIGFIVASPFSSYTDYCFELEEKYQNQLDVKHPEQVLVLSIVTMHDSLEQSTMNLLAPLIVNIDNNKAIQIIMPHLNYSTKEPLLGVHKKSGEFGC